MNIFKILDFVSGDIKPKVQSQVTETVVATKKKK